MANENKAESDIEKFARLAVSELLEAMPSLKDAKPIEVGMAINQALDSKHSSAARLKALVNGDSSFGDLRAGWIQQAYGMGLPVQSHTLSHVLIRNVIDGRLLIPLIEELCTFADSRIGITESYTAIAGITVSNAVGLGPNIDLIPWVDVPVSDQKTIFGSNLPFEKMVSPVTVMQSVATSAIRIRSTEGQVLFASSADAKLAMEASTREITIRTELIYDAVRCFTALSESPVAAIGNWSEFDQTVANRFTGTAYSFDGTLYNHSISRASSNPVALDGDKIAKLFKRFETFTPSEKVVMRVALDRLIPTCIS